MAYVLSLIAAPRKAPLSADHVAAAIAAAGATPRDARWLAPLEAWEATFDTDPACANLQRLAATWPFDVNVIDCRDRRKKLLIADMDSTMIGQECIDELAVVAGLGDEIKDITTRAMRGELVFEDAMRQRVAMIAGLPEDAISTVIAERVTLVDGGRELVQTMNAAGAYTALISGGFTQFTAHVSQRLGFHHHQANELIIAEGRLTGQVVEPVLGQDAKVAALARLCAEHAIGPNAALTVGDGANDIAMLQAAGMGVALHAKPAVREAARITIDHGDLTALLFLQGYASQEFKH